jgi:hypothetical protein
MAMKYDATSGPPADAPAGLPGYRIWRGQGWKLLAAAATVAALLGLVAWVIFGGNQQTPSVTLHAQQCVHAPAGSVVVGRVKVDNVAQYTSDPTTGWIIRLTAAAQVCTYVPEGAVVQIVGADRQDQIDGAVAADASLLGRQGCLSGRGCRRIVIVRLP